MRRHQNEFDVQVNLKNDNTITMNTSHTINLPPHYIVILSVDFLWVNVDFMSEFLKLGSF